MASLAVCAGSVPRGPSSGQLAGVSFFAGGGCWGMRGCRECRLWRDFGKSGAGAISARWVSGLSHVGLIVSGR